MALMNKCFCCGLRSGSVLSGVYCLIFSAISVALSAYVVYSQGLLSEGRDNGVFAINALQLIFFITILIVSILLLFAIIREHNRLFLPFVIVMAIYVVIQIIGLILTIVRLVQHFDGMYVFYVLYNIVCLAINILCVVCVASYYQDIRDSNEVSEPATNYA